MISTAPVRNQGEVWSLLFKFLQRYITLTEQEFRLWQPYFELRTFGKKEVVTDYGQQENYINVVYSGLARRYVRVGNGEVTMQIAPEGHVIHAETSFHRRMPSKTIVETIEATTFISLSWDNLQLLFEKYPKAERLARLFLSEMFIVKDRRYFEMVKKSTREIFLDYVTSHPHMLQRVPQKYLASYLNIKPETFSRLKHLLRKRK